MTSDPSKPILFIDIDGVLNRWESYSWRDGPRALIERDCVWNLNRIIEQTEAKLVLSSSWRQFVLGGSMTVHGFEYLLRTHGMRGELIDTTCGDDEADERGEQIRRWLRQNRKIPYEYVVIDDVDDGISSRGLVFVQTNGSKGLTEADAERVVHILKG